MNFNFDSTPEYDLNTSLIDEVIGLYGINVKFLITQKINVDSLVFGDYSHLKTDNNSIYDIFMLPESTDDWNHTNDSYSQFGLLNYENINLYVSKKNIVDYVPSLAANQGTLTGNLVVLPNQKIMEITSSVWEVPGVNNVFTSNAQRSVIKLSCKPYDNKLTSEVQASDVSVTPGVPYNTLDVYFNELIAQTTAQNVEAEVTPNEIVVQKTGAIDNTVQKPTVDNSVKDIWGNF